MVVPSLLKEMPNFVIFVSVSALPLVLPNTLSNPNWAIGHKDSKVKSFLQNMSEKAEEILQKQLEKAKDTKEEKEVLCRKNA